MKLLPTLLAAAGLATAAAAQDFGTETDRGFAATLWEGMAARGLVGAGMMSSLPYEGTEPHGVMLETFFARLEMEGHEGALIVKRNYGPDGVASDDIIAAPMDHLGSVTVMFRREAGYAPEAGDWFWAKYLPDGTLDTGPDGTALAGRVGGCISCHAGADDGFTYTTGAPLD